MALSRVLLSLIAAVLIFLCFKLLKSHQQYQSDLTWGVSQGCRSPPVLDTGRWPFGIELILEAFKAAREQRLLRLFVDIVNRTGPTFEQRLLGTSGIDTIDPANVEAILSKQFDDFGLGERRLVFYPLLGDGIFTQDGKAWAHSRALLRPAFQHDRELLSAEVAAAAEAVMDQMHEEHEIDLQPLFFRFTLQTTSFLLFGRNLDVLSGDSGGSEKVSSFAVVFDEAQDYLAKRGRLGGLYWLIDPPQFRKQCGIVHRYIDAAIAQASAARVAGEKQSAYTLLDGLLQETNGPRVLRDQCLNVLLAGRDTTACLLSWTFRLLVTHPRVLDTLKSEIAKVCEPGLAPTRAQMKRMHYLDAILKEVLRLCPSVPINSRTANRRTTLPTGGGKDGTAPVLVRKGSAVGFCPYVMHRRKDIFGEDAMLFRPERWIENDNRLFAKAGYAYVPFSAGPRACLGQDFALHEAGYMVIRMLQRWPNMGLAEDGGMAPVLGEERQKLTLVISSADGCRLILRR